MAAGERKMCTNECGDKKRLGEGRKKKGKDYVMEVNCLTKGGKKRLEFV